MARSSGVVVWTSPCSEAEADWAVAPPNAPNNTLVSGRFMASHMRALRMIPEAPTRAPAMTSAELSITKPVGTADRDHHEHAENEGDDAEDQEGDARLSGLGPHAEAENPGEEHGVGDLLPGVGDRRAAEQALEL